MNFDLIRFAFGVVCGIVPCIVWGKLGGDLPFEIHYPSLRVVLHLLHHWHIGVVIMGFGMLVDSYILGWGLGTAIDDLLFHSFEDYFVREVHT